MTITSCSFSQRNPILCQDIFEHVLSPLLGSSELLHLANSALPEDKYFDDIFWERRYIEHFGPDKASSIKKGEFKEGYRESLLELGRLINFLKKPLFPGTAHFVSLEDLMDFKDYISELTYHNFVRWFESIAQIGFVSEKIDLVKKIRECRRYELGNDSDISNLKSIFLSAAKTNRTEVLDWIKDESGMFWAISAKDIEKAFTFAAGEGHIKVLKWFKNKSGRLDENDYIGSAFAEAALKGRINVLNWFKNESGKYEIITTIGLALQFVAEAGHIKVLDWIKKESERFQEVDHTYMDWGFYWAATYCGNIKVLDWFKECGRFHEIDIFKAFKWKNKSVRSWIIKNSGNYFMLNLKNFLKSISNLFFYYISIYISYLRRIFFRRQPNELQKGASLN